MIETKFGTWKGPTEFTDEDGVDHVVYTYREVLKKVGEFFPFECFIQLDGNIIKNYVRVGDLADH